jgi:hypothetical protein
VERAERADKFHERRLGMRDARGRTYRLRSDFLNLRTEIEARITLPWALNRKYGT